MEQKKIPLNMNWINWAWNQVSFCDNQLVWQLQICMVIQLIVLSFELCHPFLCLYVLLPPPLPTFPYNPILRDVIFIFLQQ